MRLRDFTAGMLAIALSSAPLAAQASLAPARASAPMAEASEMAGEDATWLYVLGAIAVGVIIYLIVDDDDDPESP